MIVERTIRIAVNTPAVGDQVAAVSTHDGDSRIGGMIIERTKVHGPHLPFRMRSQHERAWEYHQSLEACLRVAMNAITADMIETAIAEPAGG